MEDDEAWRCQACEQDARTVFTCVAELRPGVTYYGQDLPPSEYEPGDQDAMPDRCDRCFVAKGGVHHLHCTVAGCLTHDYAQRIECPCDYPDAPPFDDQGRPW